MIASMTCVTCARPSVTLLGGCSESALLGMTHETAGRWFDFTSVKNWLESTTLPTWWSWWTSVNSGSGFQISGVWASCAYWTQYICPFAQSGWPPFST